MNTMRILTTIAAGSLLLMQSCEKKEMTVTQDVDALVKKNTSYTFTMPVNNSDDSYRITAPASHASISMLTTDASGNEVYQYVPATDYTGTDRVVIATEEESHGQGNHGGCSGGHHHEEGRVININLTVTEDGLAVKH